MTARSRDGSLEKSARLIVLLSWQDAGRLEGKSLAEISRMFQDPPNRSTIMRDLRDVKRLRVTLKQMTKGARS